MSLCSRGVPSGQRPTVTDHLGVVAMVLLPIREETPCSFPSLPSFQRERGGRYPTPSAVPSSPLLRYYPPPKEETPDGHFYPLGGSTLRPSDSRSKPIVAMGWLRRTKSGRGTSQPSSPGAGSARLSVIYGDDSRFDEEEGEFNVFYDACEVRNGTRQRTRRMQVREKEDGGPANGRGKG